MIGNDVWAEFQKGFIGDAASELTFVVVGALILAALFVWCIRQDY